MRYRERSESPRKRPRPGLNIITDFSAVPARATTKDVVVERVPKQRPQLGDRVVASVISQKAEHFYQPPQKDVQKRVRKSAMKDQSKLRMPFGSEISKPLTNTAGGQQYRHSQTSHPTDRSIVIGISVPEDQAEHHKPKDQNSALSLYTPATPQIVVTPAEEDAPWTRPAPTPRKRPASSVYSQMIHGNNRQNKAEEVVPPVPFLAKSSAFHFVTQNQTDPRSKELSRTTAHHRPVSTDTIFDDQDDVVHRADAQKFAGWDEDKVPLTGDSARPKSKGWWTLALSPMLSRAGTVLARRSPSEHDHVPPVPSKSPHLGRTTAHDDFEGPLLSPETPRRLGMGSSRTSTAGWTNWTDWEEERKHANSTARTSEDDAWKGHKAQESGATVPFMIGATPVTKGLATEYFQACAFDQRGGEPYFECHNHSCAEKLPKLVTSIDTDKGTLVDVPAPFERTAARDLALEKLQGDEPTTPHVRADSDSTAIDDEPSHFSSNMRSAKMATVMKPTAFQSTKPIAKQSAERANVDTDPATNAARDAPEAARETPLPTYSSPPRRLKPQAAVLGATVAAEHQPAVASPGPLSPDAQRDIAPLGAMAMSEVQHTRKNNRVHPQPIFINNYTSYPDAPPRTEHAPISIADIEHRYEGPPTKEINEKKDKPTRNFFGWLRCLKRKEEEGPKTKKKRLCICLIFWGLLAIVIACVLLAITLTRKGDDTPINTQWLNLTGFPPMPTGISTVIRPDVLIADDSCVQPSTLWTCAVPKEQASNIAPNDPDQPNFRFEIRFYNGTSGVDPADTIPLNGTGSPSTADDPFTNDLFTPNPAPPSDKEQIFLGNTTDNITQPFDGEATPFFITFISAFPIIPPGFNTTVAASTTRLATRQASNKTTTSLTLPSPSTTTNNSPAPAQLLPAAPFPSSQPLRLYNRGLPTEHYGVYTYYSKTLFLSTNSVTNNTAGSSGVLPDDENGGSFAASATAMCTFTQTRFLVKIFTGLDSGLALLPSSSASTSTSASSVNGSTAFDYAPPGSFPWPMSVTVDRHGGDAGRKAVFCYQMQGGEFVQPLQGVLQAEFRGEGGNLVNSPGSLVNTGAESSTSFDPNLGGTDGGTGGCKCEWGNFGGGSD